MSQNQLGKNIQHLREVRRETLEDIGNALGFAKSTIKGYENGERKPTPETLQCIAKYFGITVDDLMYSDFSDLPKLNLSADDIAKSNLDLFPIFDTEKVKSSAHFKNGLKLCREVMDRLSQNEIVDGNKIIDAIIFFRKSIVEKETPEAYANILACILIYGKGFFDKEEVMSLYHKSKISNLKLKDLDNLRLNLSENVMNVKKDFIEEYNELINEAIKRLKHNRKWADLADYYLALRYISSIVDSDLTDEQNQMVGIQMMYSYAQIDNAYALKYFYILDKVTY